jgi:hypothetical protein
MRHSSRTPFARLLINTIAAAVAAKCASSSMTIDVSLGSMPDEPLGSPDVWNLMRSSRVGALALLARQTGEPIA